VAPHMVGEWHSVWKAVGNVMDVYRGHVILKKKCNSILAFGAGEGGGCQHELLDLELKLRLVFGGGKVIAMVRAV
jgi:hypothetical protein